MNKNEISKEAIRAANLECGRIVIAPNGQFLIGQYVQEVVNQSTAPLREEISVLRNEIKAIEKDCTVEKCRRLEGENFRQEREIERLKKENTALRHMWDGITPAEEVAVMRHQLTTKREVLEKCVEELRKQIKHLHSSSAYYQSGQSVLTLANEELKKGGE